MRLRWPWTKHPPPVDLAESKEALHEAQRRQYATSATLRRRQRETVKNHFARDIKRAFGI